MKPDDLEENGKLKLTIYLDPELVDQLDALKVEDQAARLVSRHMSRPTYIAWALARYGELRKRPASQAAPKPKR